MELKILFEQVGNIYKNNKGLTVMTCPFIILEKGDKTMIINKNILPITDLEYVIKTLINEQNTNV